MTWLERTHQHAWGCVMCFLPPVGRPEAARTAPAWLGAGPRRARSVPGVVPLRCGEGRTQKSPRSRAEPAPARGTRSGAGLAGCGEKQRCWTCFAAGEQRQREVVARPCCAGGCLRSWAPLRTLLRRAGRWAGVREGVCRQGQPPAVPGVGRGLFGVVITLHCGSLCPLQAERIHEAHHRRRL